MGITEYGIEKEKETEQKAAINRFKMCFSVSITTFISILQLNIQLSVKILSIVIIIIRESDS